MQTRISYGKVAHEGIETMAALEQNLRTCGLEKSLLDPVMPRASQVSQESTSRPQPVRQERTQRNRSLFLVIPIGYLWRPWQVVLWNRRPAP